mgnify:CR=1 FL=1
MAEDRKQWRHLKIIMSNHNSVKLGTVNKDDDDDATL